MKSFFPYKDRFAEIEDCLQSQLLDCDAFYIGITKRRLHDRKTEHFKALTQVGHANAVADHSTSTGYNIKCDHSEQVRNLIYSRCKIKENIVDTAIKTRPKWKPRYWKTLFSY